MFLQGETTYSHFILFHQIISLSYPIIPAKYGLPIFRHFVVTIVSYICVPFPGKKMNCKVEYLGSKNIADYNNAQASTGSEF